MQISEITKKYWTDEEYTALDEMQTIADMSLIADKVITRMPTPIVQVCGPIASGGLGNLEANLDAFNKEIYLLQEKGFNVFDQMPFELPMQELKKKLDHPSRILDEFYLPIFKSKKVSTVYFMKGWETSVGATWEHKVCQELGIEIKYL